MKITSVTYGRLRSFGNYENESVSATAEVREGASAHNTLQDLRKWVDEQLGNAEQNSRADDQLWKKREQLRTLHRQIANAQEWHGKAAAILKAHGVEIKPLPEVDLDLDDTPW